MVIFFSFLEFVEIRGSGPLAYFSDMWNVADWTNFVVYYMMYERIKAVASATLESPEHSPCTSDFCTRLGYFDDWKVMATY